MATLATVTDTILSVVVNGTPAGFLDEFPAATAGVPINPTHVPAPSIHHRIMKHPGIVVGANVYWTLFLVAGLLLTFWGYRFFRLSVVAMGFILGGAICAHFADQAFHNDIVSTIVLLLAGVFFAWAANKSYKLGVFLAGVWGGFVVANLLYTTYVDASASSKNVGHVVLTLLFCIIGGYLSLRLERPALIVATAAVGAQLAVEGLGFFLGNYPSEAAVREVVDEINHAKVGEVQVPDAWIYYVLGHVALFIIGVIVQFKVTAAHNPHAELHYAYQPIPESHLPLYQHSTNGYGAPATAVPHGAPQPKGQPVSFT